jgi:hypothetical protein
MDEYVSNYLTLSGGKKKDLRKIAKVFSKAENSSGDYTKGIFKSLIGRNPAFHRVDKVHHDQVTYGTEDELSVGEIVDSIDESGELYVSFQTARSPVIFTVALSKLYGINALLSYEEDEEPYDIGKFYISSGIIIESSYIHFASSKYHANTKRFIQEEGEGILNWAVKYYTEEIDFKIRDLSFMSDNDKKYFLDQFRQRKALLINN